MVILGIIGAFVTNDNVELVISDANSVVLVPSDVVCLVRVDISVTVGDVKLVMSDGMGDVWLPSDGVRVTEAIIKAGMEVGKVELVILGAIGAVVTNGNDGKSVDLVDSDVIRPVRAIDVAGAVLGDGELVMLDEPDTVWAASDVALDILEVIAWVAVPADTTGVGAFVAVDDVGYIFG